MEICVFMGWISCVTVNGKWLHRGHYSILVPAGLYLGGQRDSDLSTWREAADGRTPTCLSRLVRFFEFTAPPASCFQKAFCFCMCRPFSSSFLVCVPLGLCVCVIRLWVRLTPLCQGWLQTAALTVDASFNWQTASRPPSSSLPVANSISILIHHDSHV